MQISSTTVLPPSIARVASISRHILKSSKSSRVQSLRLRKSALVFIALSYLFSDSTLLSGMFEFGDVEEDE
jgi:hypothetical protein